MSTCFLVTGGAGFIGSNFVRYILGARPDAQVRVLDKLTYAGNLENLESLRDDSRFSFTQGDICDEAVVREVMSGADVVVHFAAETHVDRSILHAGDFITTDVLGTYVLLEAARECQVERFIQISTDEVYGEVVTGASKETDPLMPRNPYSASKAGADRMAYAFCATYGLPVIITRASNNYGPYQYPEKLIPFFVSRALRDEHLPVYGDGQQVRDWLHVLDHCRALDLIVERGDVGEVYNIGAGEEHPNLEVVHIILETLGKPEDLVEFVKDRPGHDRRYALDCTKVHALGWRPQADFSADLPTTVRWFAEHEDWIERSLARSRAYFEQQYAKR